MERTIDITYAKNTITVWLNRPEKHNALSPRMIHELTSFFSQLTPDSTRSVILRGKGESFCAGADLAWMQQASELTDEENLEDTRKLATLFHVIYSVPVPVIAVTHGTVYGGGIGIIAAADFVLADKSTRFSLSETRLGLSPSTIMPYLLNRIRLPELKELIYSARSIDATEAIKIGLVDHLMETSDIEPNIRLFVEQFLVGAPGALAESKRLIHLLHGKLTNDLREITVQSIANRRKSMEAKEGIAAFFEKRKPFWQQDEKEED